MDFLAVYSEAGMIGVVGAMFVFMVYSMNKRGNEQAESLQNLKVENKGQSETLENMESLRVTGVSTGLGFVYWTDIISGILMCMMFAIQIYYLYLKTKRIKEN